MLRYVSMPTVLANSGDVTSRATATVGATSGGRSTRREIVDIHPAMAPVEATSTRPTATTPERVTKMPMASSHTFKGLVAVFEPRNSVRPQCQCSARFLAYDMVIWPSSRMPREATTNSNTPAAAPSAKACTPTADFTQTTYVTLRVRAPGARGILSGASAPVTRFEEWCPDSAGSAAACGRGTQPRPRA